VTFAKSTRIRLAALALAAAAVLLTAGVAVAGAARARAATVLPPSMETVGLGGVLGSDPGFEAKRRGRLPTDSSGAFVYRKGMYGPIGAIPGAAPISAVPGFPDVTVAQTHFAINDRGETAGFYADAAPGPDGTLPPGSTHGFVKDRRGEVASFDVPDASFLLVKGNNDRGQVVGEYGDAGATPGPDGMLPPGSVHGFVRDRRGAIRSFDVPFFRLHDVADLNDRGQIVGYYDNPDNAGGGAFLREPNGAIRSFDVPFFRLHDVADLNDRGQIVGYYDNPDNAGGGAFLREPNGAITRIDVPGALVTNAHAINNRGQVVGAYLEAGAVPNPDGTVPANAVHGYRWDKGRMRRLDVPGSIWTQPFGINDRGQISGGYYDAAGRQHGFVLDRGRYKTLDAPGRTDNIAWGINDRGEVVIPEGTVRLLPVATP
jgi:hypothetical protein